MNWESCRLCLDWCQNSAMASYDFVDVEPVSIVQLAATCTHDRLGPTISDLFAQLWETHGEAELMGPPMVVYVDWRERDCDIEAALPVDPSTTEGAVSKEGCTAVRTTHVGPYETLPEAWLGMWKFIADNGVDADVRCWDSYVVGPGQEPNADKWVTELFVPLKKHGAGR